MQEQRSTSLNIAPGVTLAPDSLRLQFARGGGPGGQNVNKLNTKAELWVALAGIRGLAEGARHRLALIAAPYLTLAGEIHLYSFEHRTQERNRQEVLDKLRNLVVMAQVVPKKRRRTKPSAASRRRRVDDKRHRGQIKAGRSGQGGD